MGAIDKEEAGKLLAIHYKWVDAMRDEWDEMRRAYEDRFWGADSGSQAVHGLMNPGTITFDGQVLDTMGESAVGEYARTQVNILKGFVGKFEAGMFYRGLNLQVTPDQLHIHDTGADPAKLGEGIGAMVTRFFQTEDAIRLNGQSLKQALLYRGGGAFVVGLDQPNELIPGQGPEDLAWLEYAPPWEAVWDRRATGKHRYKGRLRYLPVDEVEELFDTSLAEEDLHALPDVVGNDYGAERRETLSDKSYVVLFDLLDFTCTTEVELPSGEKIETVGGYATYLVRDPGTRSDTADLVELYAGPTPFQETDGRPMSNIVPVILDPHPDFPHENLAAGKRVYDLVRELNLAMSALATAYRRDLNRIVVYLKDRGVDENVIQQILNSPDMTFVAVDAETLEGLFKVLELPQLSPTLLEYIKFLRESLTETQVLADQMGGKAAKYQTATQTATLVDYSESTLGLLRLRNDAVMAGVARVFQAVFKAACMLLGVDSVTVEVAGEFVDIPVSALERRWVFQVIDGATTPAQRAAELDRFLGLAPTLIELATALGFSQQMMALVLDRIVQLGGLPAAFSTAGLTGSAGPAGPAPMPEADPAATMPTSSPTGQQQEMPQPAM